MATAFQAKATLVYDNGPADGTNAYNLSPFNYVSNSFTSSGSFHLTSVQADLSGKPLTIDWVIGTAPFGGDIASGTSSFLNPANGTFDISAWIGAGTFYLTLGNPTTLDEGALLWNVSNGPSTAYIDGPMPEASNSFRIYGVPEAGQTATLLIIGLAAMGSLRRKMRGI